MIDKEMANNPEQLDQLLDVCLEDLRLSQDGPQTILLRFPDQADHLRPSLEAAAWLSQQVGMFDPLPGFIPGSRQRLVERIQREQALQPVPPPPSAGGIRGALQLLLNRQGMGRALATALVLVLFVIAGAGGAALASESALPGQSLYPVKLAAEQAQLAFTFGEEADAHLYLRFAGQRLKEIQELSAKGEYVLIPETARRYEKNMILAAAMIQASDFTDPDRVMILTDSLNETLNRQKLVILSLAGDIPDDIRIEVVRAVEAAEVELMGAAAFLSKFDLLDLSRQPTATPTLTPADIHASPAFPAIQFGTLTPSIPLTGGTAPPPSQAATPTQSQEPTPDSSGPEISTGTIVPTQYPTRRVRPTEKAEPTEEPEPTESGQPTPKPKPTSAPEPTQAPKPTDRPEPTQKPKPTSAPEPTEKPAPTEEPEPTEEPRPTKEPKPTEEPEPTEVPEPTREIRPPEKPTRPPGPPEKPTPSP